MIWALMLAVEPPDYVTLTHKADRLAQAAASVKSCERLGFTADAGGIQAESQRIIDDAVVNGISGNSAEMIMSDALKQETSYQEDRASVARQTGAMQPFLDYWLRRCNDLARDPTYSNYFTEPEHGE